MLGPGHEFLFRCLCLKSPSRSTSGSLRIKSKGAKPLHSIYEEIWDKYMSQVGDEALDSYGERDNIYETGD